MRSDFLSDPQSLHDSRFVRQGDHFIEQGQIGEFYYQLTRAVITDHSLLVHTYGDA